MDFLNCEVPSLFVFISLFEAGVIFGTSDGWLRTKRAASLGSQPGDDPSVVGWIKAGWCEVLCTYEDIRNRAQPTAEDEIDATVGRCLIRNEVFAVQGQGEAGIIRFGGRPGVRHRAGNDVIGVSGRSGSAIEVAGDDNRQVCDCGAHQEFVRLCCSYRRRSGFQVGIDYANG